MATQMRRDPNRNSVLDQYIQYPHAGRTFFVNRASEGGSDDNDGTTPESAFLSITHALSHCTTGANDYIFVNRCDAATETWPIVISKSYVHLIGQPHQAIPTATLIPDSDAHAIDITAGGGVEIAGFNFGSDKSWLKAGINAGAGTWMDHIHHNIFAWTSEMHDCILVNGGGGSCTITDNKFGAHGFDGKAITSDVNTGRLWIENNVFMVAGVEMNGECGIRASGHGHVILNNYFTLPDLAVGEAIDLDGVGRGLVAGNVAGALGGVLGNVPYEDTAATQNHWTNNIGGIVAINPV